MFWSCLQVPAGGKQVFQSPWSDRWAVRQQGSGHGAGSGSPTGPLCGPGPGDQEWGRVLIHSCSMHFLIFRLLTTVITVEVITFLLFLWKMFSWTSSNNIFKIQTVMVLWKSSPAGSFFTVRNIYELWDYVLQSDETQLFSFFVFFNKTWVMSHLASHSNSTVTELTVKKPQQTRPLCESWTVFHC